MRPLGWHMTGRKWRDLRWEKYTGEDQGGSSEESETPNQEFSNGIIEGRFGIGWNPNTDKWVILIPITWQGREYLILSNKTRGWLGTGLGARYYGGTRDPDTGEITPDTPVTDDGLIDAIDKLIEENPTLQNDVLPAREGDTITAFSRAQLRAVGRDEGMDGEKLTAEDAEAVNQGPQK